MNLADDNSLNSLQNNRSKQARELQNEIIKSSLRQREANNNIQPVDIQDKNFIQ